MNKSFIKRITIFVTGIIITISCADEPLKVGIDILPEEDRLTSKSDSLSISCITRDYSIPGYSTNPESESSIKTDICPVGHVNDSVFGQTWAQLFLNFSKGLNYYKPDDDNSSEDIFDECAIYLNIQDALSYADSLGFNVIVHPLHQSARYGASAGAPATNYLVKSDEFTFEDTPVSESTERIFYQPDSDVNFLDTGNYLVVKLNDAFGMKYMDTTHVNDYSNSFPGFYVTGEVKTGSIGGINNFYYSKSKLVLKYTRPGGKADGSDSTVYAYHDLESYQGFYKHDYNSAKFKNDLDSGEESSNFYVQFFDGVKGFIKLTELESFREENEGKVGINLAELVFPMAERFDTNTFTYPNRLTALTIKNNIPTVIIDDYLGDAAYFNGYYDLENSEYRLNITEVVHKYMDGDLNAGTDVLYLCPAAYNFAKNSALDYKTPGRVVLNSGSHATKPAYLRLIYTLTDN